MYEVSYYGRRRTSYFHCRTRQEGLLYDGERDLLAIDKFLVKVCNS